MILTPALRHLEWLCTAPPLWRFPEAFVPADWLPLDWQETLTLWDAVAQEALARDPQAHDPMALDPQAREQQCAAALSLPDFVLRPPNPRLGLYFETLYEALLVHLLGWEVLARNLPIRAGGLTLGELDFVVRNPRTGQVEHHEIAVKFYLGYQAPEQGLVQWLGPNPADSLEGKARRMLEEQSRRTQLPEAQDVLRSLLAVGGGLVGAGLPANTMRSNSVGAGLPANLPDVPLPARVFMPGYLFYPQDNTTLAAPPQVPAHHAQGTWLRLEDALHADHTGWVPLLKPHWLGLWQQTQTPEEGLVLDALQQVASTGTPRLLARVAWDAVHSQWCERARFFVVPAAWPGRGQG